MYYFIVNPKSSSGKGAKIWDALEQKLRKKKISYEVFFTKGILHAAELANTLINSKTPCTIVAVGGDGTANEVINGLAAGSGITFGYIPTGSSNDLARGLGLPSDPLQALEIILNPTRIHDMRIGINSSGTAARHFAVSTGIGFDAAVCHEALHSRLKKILNKFRLGKLTYTGIALRQLIRLKPSAMELVLDNQKKFFYRNVYLISVMNVKYEGGGLMFCPEAVSDDDYLDICVVENISKFNMLRLLPLAFQGKHIHAKGVHIFRCHTAVIRSDVSLPVHTDGEYHGHRDHITVTLDTAHLSFITG